MRNGGIEPQEAEVVLEPWVIRSDLDAQAVAAALGRDHEPAAVVHDVVGGDATRQGFLELLNAEPAW